MRNKYSKEFENEMIIKAQNRTLEQLLWIANNKYNYQINKDQLRQYLSKRKIRYSDYNDKKIREMGNDYPIGSEYIKPDGMTLVKIAKDRWEYKQRYIYEQKYGKLPTEIMVIFLDGNRNNFDINNLMAVSASEYNYIRNKHLIFKNSNLTKTAILSARLYYKIKEKLEILKGEDNE